jgi:hypothetical protein
MTHSLAKPTRGLRAALTRAWPALLAAVVLTAPWLGSALFLDDWHLLWKASQADWSWEGLSRAFTFLDPGAILTWNLPVAPAYHYFRPLVVASYKLDMALWGLTPLGFHLESLLLHLGSVVLVGALAARVTGDGRVGRLAALLFAIQPHNPAAVCWTAGRTEALGALLMLGALLSYVIARQERRPRLLGWTLALTALACLTKENAVLVGGFAGAWELTRLTAAWRAARGGEGEAPETLREWARRALAPLAALAVLLIAYLVYRFGVFDSLGALGEPYFTSPLSPGFAGFALTKSIYYLAALVTTAPIIPLFGTAFLLEQPAVTAAAALVVIVALWGLARAARGHRVTLLAGLWVALAFLPTLPILASDLYPYFAGVGSSLLLAAALADRTRARRVVLIGLVALYALGYTGRGLLFHVQGEIDRVVREDVERDLGGPAPEGLRLLLVNLPISASHVASHLRLRAGHGDVTAVLVTLTPEWAAPPAGPEVACLSPDHVRIGPPPGHEALFESKEEWNIHLFRVPIDPTRRYGTPHGFQVAPVWEGAHAVALDLHFDPPLTNSHARIYSFYQDKDGHLAHRKCGPEPAASRPSAP